MTRLSTVESEFEGIRSRKILIGCAETGPTVKSHEKEPDEAATRRRRAREMHLILYFRLHGMDWERVWSTRNGQLPSWAYCQSPFVQWRKFSMSSTSRVFGVSWYLSRVNVQCPLNGSLALIDVHRHDNRPATLSVKLIGRNEQCPEQRVRNPETTKHCSVSPAFPIPVPSCDWTWMAFVLN